MKLKNTYFVTKRENVKDEDSISGNLLVRSGMVKKVGSGIYMYLPLGLKVLQKIENIVKEEMNNIGAQEVLMPSLIPEDIYEKSGRVEAFGQDMFKLKDRFNHSMVLGPTHEELFTIAALNMIKSYKDLPFILYQSADKFRDEPRPRYGLIRVREFFMKDAYSFDTNEENLNISYAKVFNAYIKIFDRIGLNYKIVKSSTGTIGGILSEEFQAITEIGEDTLVLCNHCDYSSNLEIATSIKEDNLDDIKGLELISTPNIQSIDELSKYLKINKRKLVKAMLMKVNNELVVLFLRGDRELNKTKVCNLFNTNDLSFADDFLISHSNAVPGYTGPINLNTKIVIDEEILHMKNFVVGANKEGYHYINANSKDFKYDIVADISNVLEGDTCPICKNKIYLKKGIEIGNTFKLGTKYSSKLDLTYLDENNNKNEVVMGCYGIGYGRILASLIEQNHDEKGIIFPISVAPYQVCLVPTNTKDELIMNIANKLYLELNKNNIDTLLDDRNERVGVKFNDMDLIGIPIRITIGKKVIDNLVELKLRKENTSKDILIDDVVFEVKKIINKV